LDRKINNINLSENTKKQKEKQREIQRKEKKKKMDRKIKNIKRAENRTQIIYNSVKFLSRKETKREKERKPVIK
jgi:hypothetical protein